MLAIKIVRDRSYYSKRPKHHFLLREYTLRHYQISSESGISKAFQHHTVIILSFANVCPIALVLCFVKVCVKIYYVIFDKFRAKSGSFLIGGGFSEAFENLLNLRWSRCPQVYDAFLLTSIIFILVSYFFV